MTLDANLRRARKRLGWSRKEAADRAGVAPNALYLYETGRQRPSQLALLGLAALYGCSTDWLLSDHDSERDDAFPGTLAGSSSPFSDAAALRPPTKSGWNPSPSLALSPPVNSSNPGRNPTGNNPSPTLSSTKPPALSPSASPTTLSSATASTTAIP